MAEINGAGNWQSYRLRRHQRQRAGPDRPARPGHGGVLGPNHFRCARPLSVWSKSKSILEASRSSSSSPTLPAAPRVLLPSTDHVAMAPGTPEEGEAGQQGVAPGPQREREDAEVLGEDDGFEEYEEEEAPTHLPFAPSSERSEQRAPLIFICFTDARYFDFNDAQLPDDSTTVDPSYTISLIRQLLPQGSNVEKEFRQVLDLRGAKQGVPEEKEANQDKGEATELENKDPWEESGCILWDLAASKPQAELMMNNLVLEVLLANLHVTQSPRVKEICLGIMGNLACHESLVNAMSLQNGLIATVVDQLFLDDSACLSETFSIYQVILHDRLLSAVLRSSASVSWAEALSPDEILSRVLWIVGNTLNSTLLEKSIDFLSTVIDSQDVSTILLQPLIKVGVIDHAISLLASEFEKLSDESKLDRASSLDLILHFIEELSSLDSCSEVMSSSEQLIQVLYSIVKLPDKFEVTSYCASVVIILANILADGKQIVPILSHDIPFMEGLFDILPLVADDKQARNALWCTLARLLAQTRGIDVNSTYFEQFASLVLGRFTLIKDDLDSHRVEKKENLSAEDAYLKHGVSTSVSFQPNNLISK
ncbi:hypothetical protein PR202_ga13027 [Eleusine coracana subsp. coracana]|uniref:ARM repeat superfamily protein n=1 Tax=Eleusine coracana subsp. coracana TaxID=191504 RepID=A0AAV5CDR1_ELECO|nr:hypothetical protein PR202_ga13027 [Eleusine coracana subsp. coracana]